MEELTSLTRVFTITCQSMGFITMSLLHVTLRQVAMQKHQINKSRIFYERRSMRWGLHGRIDYLMHFGLIERPIKHHLECHHINWSTGRPVIYLLSWNSRLTGLLGDGTWTLKLHEQRERCNSQNSMNDVKKHITIPRFTRREPKDGMTRGLRRSSLSEIRYYLLILGLNYLGTKNFRPNGKDHSM